MHELELRISDLDRERAAAVLHQAVSEGRLTWPEHEQRLSGVYAARTGADLAPWLVDLPGAPRFAASRPSAARPLQVTLSKVRRRPTPDAGIQQVDVVLGAAVLDLRDLPPGSFLDIVANSTLGKVEVYVTADTTLIDEGTAWLGKRSTVDHRRRGTGRGARAGAPVVRLSGHSLLGHVRVTVV